MLTNIGGFDRLVRLVLSAALLYAGLQLYGGSTLGMVLAVAAIVPAFTAIGGFCPLYRLLGIRTGSSES